MASRFDRLNAEDPKPVDTAFLAGVAAERERVLGILVKVAEQEHRHIAKPTVVDVILRDLQKELKPLEGKAQRLQVGQVWKYSSDDGTTFLHVISSLLPKQARGPRQVMVRSINLHSGTLTKGAGYVNVADLLDDACTTGTWSLIREDFAREGV